MLKNRRSIRLKSYDYSQANSYFVTICTHEMKNLFGFVENEIMQLNQCGRFASNCWLKIPSHFNNVEIDEFIVMPNHVHGIINILDVNHRDFRKNDFQKIIPASLGSIIRSYKAAVTQRIHENFTIKDVWQRNYYEHIIENEDESIRIRDYIIQNPLKWEIEKNEKIKNLW